MIECPGHCIISNDEYDYLRSQDRAYESMAYPAREYIYPFATSWTPSGKHIRNSHANVALISQQQASRSHRVTSQTFSSVQEINTSSHRNGVQALQASSSQCATSQTSPSVQETEVTSHYNGVQSKSDSNDANNPQQTRAVSEVSTSSLAL
jgi:hypothetical protein